MQDATVVAVHGRLTGHMDFMCLGPVTMGCMANTDIPDLSLHSSCRMI